MGASQMKLNPITDNIMKRIHQMSLEEKLQTLKEDFLDRDQTTFVKIRRTGRLGWESSIPEGTPYSDYILSPASDEELIKNSYRLAEDMIKVMDTPFKVRVRISPDGSRTDGKTVWVATEVFDDTDLPIGNRIDTFLLYNPWIGIWYSSTGKAKVSAYSESRIYRTNRRIIRISRSPQTVNGTPKPSSLTPKISFSAAQSSSTSRRSWGGYRESRRW